MGQKADVEFKMSSFLGMVSNVNRTDLRPGQSFLQINVTAVRHGQLEVRLGLRELTFDADYT